MTTRPAVLLLLVWLTPGCITESTWDENIVTSCEHWSDCPSEYCRAGTCVEPGEIGTVWDDCRYGRYAASPAGVFCAADCSMATCPTGTTCIGFTNIYDFRLEICFPTCTTDDDCPGGLDCMSGICHLP